jgi:N-acetylmuramoyl-L-alanine amidase
VHTKHTTIANRGVKKAASQILLGTHMPTILVELGFLTNLAEEALLTSQSYQNLLVRGIVTGIHTYCQNDSCFYYCL